MSSVTNPSTSDRLARVQNEIRFESQLLANRLNAFLTSQSFLLIAFSSALSSSNGDWRQPFTVLLPPLFALLGLVLAFEARLAIGAAHSALEQWRRRETDLIVADETLRIGSLIENDRALAESQRRRRAGTLFATRAPVIFGLSWLVLGVLPFGLYFWG